MNINWIFLFLSLLIQTAQAKQHVDLIVFNATVYTIDENFSIATTLVIDQGKILAIGNDTLLNTYHSNNIIDAKHKFIYPGFIDAHCHYTGYAIDRAKLKLHGVKSFEQMVKKVVEFSKHSHLEWIEAVGWDQNNWKRKDFPNKDTFDKLFPNRPVFLMRIDGHAALVNQRAIEMANLQNYASSSNAEIEYIEGKMTGIVIDNAMEQVKDMIPIPERQKSIKNIIIAQHEFFKLGLTSVVECGVKNYIIDYLQEAYASHQLKLRSTMMLVAKPLTLQQYLNQTPIRTNQLHVAGFKIFADGSLGSRGAYLSYDYCDKLNHHGAFMMPIDTLKTIAEKIALSPYQLCVHAIGDASNREVLDIYRKVLKRQNTRRWRIEHAQLVNKEDLHYFHDYSIIPSVQPTHATSDMPWVEDRIGKGRMPNAYAYKELLVQNDWLPLGTDFPVEYLNPLYTFYAAVFRRDKNYFPLDGFQIVNALSREEALRGMTIWAAKSVFEEDVKGSLEVGKLADFVILNKDLMHAKPKEIYNAKVIATYINGEKVYQSK